MNNHEYRGKRIDNGEWVYGSLVKDVFFVYPENEEKVHYFIFENLNTFHEVTPETIGRYTGFKSKNEQKIYQNDILFYPDEPESPHYLIYWDEKEGRFADERLEDGDSETFYEGCSFDFVTGCHIYGNTTDNPELLQEGEVE